MDLLVKGQKIALYFEKDSNYVEMICAVDNVYNDRLSLILPQYFMRYVDSLQEGCELTAKVFSKFGTIDFNTIVISSPLEDVFEIELDYNSLKLTENEEISVVSAVETMTIITDKDEINVKTYELSTEFLRFYSDKNFSVGDVYKFNLILPKEYGIIKFTGIISEIDPIYENEYTVKYSIMTETDRQTLLYYMYVYSIDAE